MKRPYIILLGSITVATAAFFILTSLRVRNDFRFEHSAEEMHTQLLREEHYVQPARARELLEAGDQKYVFVDIRNPNAYADYSIEGSVNVPMQTVLTRENLKFFKGEGIKILVDDNSIDSNQIWLLLSQYGIDNMLVLEGGLDYWEMRGQDDQRTSDKLQFDDEKPTFDYGELVKDGGVTQADDEEGSTSAPMPPVQRKGRTKVQGGCS